MTGIPRVSLVAGASGGFNAGRVTPRQDATAQQIGQVGQGLQAAGSAVQEIEEGIDYTRAKEADNLAADLEQSLWQDPKTGYRFAVGRDAIDRRDQVDKKWQEGIQNIERTLRTPRQLEVFRDAAKRRSARFQGQVDVHYAGQQRAWEAGTNEASAKNNMNAAISGFGTRQGEVDAALMHRDLDSIADLQGFGRDDPQRKQLHQEWSTNLHGARATQLISSGHSSAAMDYLAEQKGEIDPVALTRLQDAARRGGVRDDSLRLSQDVLRVAAEVQGASPAEQKQFALDTALATFNGKKITAEVHDAVVARIDDHFRRRSQADAELGQQALSQAEQFLSNNPLVVDLPPELQIEIEKRGMIPQVRAFARTGRYVTDPDVAVRARSMSTQQLRDLTPAQLFVQFRGGLDNSDWSQLEAAHAKALGNDTPKHRSILTTKDYLERAARRMGILPEDPLEKPSDDQQRRFEQMRDTLDDRLQRWQDAGGKTATEDDVRSMVDLEVIHQTETVTIDVRRSPLSIAAHLGAMQPLSGMFERQMPLNEVTAEDAITISARVGGKKRYLREMHMDVQKWVQAQLMLAGRPATAGNTLEHWVDLGEPGPGDLPEDER